MKTTTHSARVRNPRPARKAPPPGVLASPAQTRADLLKWTGRGYTVARHVLVQLPSSETDRPSVLGPMVTERKRRSLQLFLLLLTLQPLLQSREEKGEQPHVADVYARALTTDKGRKWTASHVSAALRDLKNRGLIEKRRLPHGLYVLPRREDGQADYTKPGLIKGDRWETYFVLPSEFWTDEWFEKLSLPGLAMLLIIAAETSKKPAVWLTNKNAAEWYGISERSIQTGIDDLRDAGLLDIDEQWFTAPQSGIGATCRHYYSLTGAFSFEARTKIRRRARRALQKRTLADTSISTKGKKARKAKKHSTTTQSVPSTLFPAPPLATPMPTTQPTTPKETP